MYGDGKFCQYLLNKRYLYLYRWRLELMPLTPNHQKNAFLQYPCSDIEVEKSLKKQLEKCHLLAQLTCEYSEPTRVVDRGPKTWRKTRVSTNKVMQKSNFRFQALHFKRKEWIRPLIAVPACLFTHSDQIS